MSPDVLYILVQQVSIFGLVACAVAYIYAMLNPNIERHFRKLAQGVTAGVGIILVIALLTLMRY